MLIQVINSGNELLSGSVTNTDLVILGRGLASIDMSISRAYLIRDDEKEYFQTLHSALSEADVVIVTGGMGPTSDDLSVPAAAKFCSCRLVRDADTEKKLYDYWKRVHPGEKPPKSYFRQSMIPEGCLAYANLNGTAPGVRMEVLYNGKKRWLYLLPGPPDELIGMLDNYLLNEWRQMAAGEKVIYGFLVAGAPEIKVQDAIEQHLGKRGGNFEISYCANTFGTRVFVAASDGKKAKAQAEKLRGLFGNDALEVGELELPDAVVKRAAAAGVNFSFAESCTGGLLGSLICEVPGASEVFWGSMVTYSNALKEKILGVERKTIRTFGAVSAKCAGEMARGAARVTKTKIALAITGIAGPGGGTPAKPVGTVFISIKSGRRLNTLEKHFSGSRKLVREKAAATALLLLYRTLVELAK